MPDDITIRAKVELDIEKSQAEQQIQQKVNDIKAKIPVSIDGKDIQQSVQNAINKTKLQTPIRIPVQIDSSGMSAALSSFQKQIENYKKTIRDAGGVISKAQIMPSSEETEWADGSKHVEESYKAILTYKTAVGETVQEIMSLNTATGEITQNIDKITVDFDKQRKEMDNLTSSVAKYKQQLETLKGKAAGFLGENISDADPFKKLVNSISFDNIGDPAQLQQMVNLLQQAQEQYKALNAAITNNKMGDSAQIMKAKLEQIPIEIERIQAKFSGFTMPENIAAQIERVNELLAKVNTAETNETRNAAYNELISIMNTLSGATDNAINKQKMLNAELANQQKAQDKLNSLIARYKASGQRYSAFKSDSGLVSEYQTLGKTIEELQARLDRVKATGVWDKSITADIASANAQMSQFNNHVVAAGKNTKSIKDRFKEAFSTFGTWLSATGLMMRAIQGFKQAVAAVKDIDAAMTNLKKVTNETSEAYNQYLKNVGKQAQQIGSSMSDLIESASTFAKLGYSFKEAQGLSEVATIFANVGDFSNIGTATNGLITAMKSFHITADEAMLIADRINEVANNYAVSADDLTTGLTHSASALSLAGNSIDETIAMITAMSEITQNASESGKQHCPRIQ